MASGSDTEPDFWDQRTTCAVNLYPVTLRREQEVQRSQAGRHRALENRRQHFLDEYDLDEADGPSLIDTSEARDLRHWCENQSWSFCAKCGKLSTRKLLPSFRAKKAPPLDTACKCGGSAYVVPQPDDVSLPLRNLSEADLRILRPLDIHCGDYKRMVHGYRQRTGPFRVTWSALLVEEKLQTVEDPGRRRKLEQAYRFLMAKADSSYKKFVIMQSRGVRTPFLYEIFSAPDYHGIECALWPSLYHKTSMCESLMQGQSNRASGKISFLHKVSSPVSDFSLNFELLQYQYDRWLFKTITGAINSSRASGCSPNAALQQKSFSATYWQWQHLYLIDAVRQYGNPSFFLTISPYEWSFPWPAFIKNLHEEHSLEPTDLPILETLHVAHVLEQIARGYLTGANTNRWRQHLFGNSDNPTDSNLLTYFYRFEFQKRGTLHLHMLVWVKDITVIRANLLHASIPCDNAEDAFLVADTQKSDRTCLPIRSHQDSFVQGPDGRDLLEFLYTEEDARRNIRAYVTTLLGSLRCRTDVQLADGKAMLLKYVSSYVTKMHETATSEGLYCCDITGYQAANSFLRTVRPLAPEMIFQLSSIKVAWTDKLTKQFRVPHPGQEGNNVVYQLYIRRDRGEEHLSILQWLRNHTTTANKAKTLAEGKYLVGVKFVSVFNPAFFFQHLLMHHPHRNAQDLRHREESTMPFSIRHFSQAVVLCPDKWTTGSQITSQFHHEAHRQSFITTIVAYVMALHDIMYLWRIQVVDQNIGSLHALSVESLYPLSPHQKAIFQDIVSCLAKRQRFLDISSDPCDSSSSDWTKYRVLCGKPGTGKSQVLIRAIHHALQQESQVLVAAPVALLAQGYRSIFGTDLEAETIHAAFHIPVNQDEMGDMNYNLNKFDMVVVDEASLVSRQTFETMAITFNRLNVRPVVVVTGDKCQQQPLQTAANGRVSTTVSILNDPTFTQENSVKHALYQQFRIVDADYARFVDLM